MVKISENLKKLINADSRTFRIKLINGESVYEEIRAFKKSILFPNSSMSIGNALSACIECTATDVPVSIAGAEIEAQITILDSEEWIRLGKFTVEKPTVQDGNVSFLAYDKMTVASNKTYTSSLSEGEHTAQEYFSDICSVLGAECVELPEELGGLLIVADKLSGYSCRDAFAYLAGFLGRNCIVNCDGLFEMIGSTAVDYDMLNADRIAEPELSDTDCVIGYIACCVDNETTLMSGEGSNGFEFISPIMTQERLDSIKADMLGDTSVVKVYKPGKIKQLLGDPTLEIGDVVPFDFFGEKYNIPIMSLVLDYDGGLQVEIESFDLAETNSLSLGERVSFQQKQAKEATDTYIKAIVEFSQAIQQAYGVKSTEIDGIVYFHDTEDITDAEYIFCMTSKGFAIASGVNCWGGSHKDTTWKYGINKDGEAVLNMLNVFHIKADLIEAGKLTSKDGTVYFDLDNGEIVISKLDENGEESVGVQLGNSGLIMKTRSTGSLEDITLTEEELAELKSKYDTSTFLGKIAYNAAKLGLMMQKLLKNLNYGFSIQSEDDTYSYLFHNSGNKTVFTKTNKESNEAEVYAETTADGVKSDAPYKIEAPEIILAGSLTPQVIPSGTDFDTVTDNGNYVGEVSAGNGTTSNYVNCPIVETCTFKLKVSSLGIAGQKMQTMTTCHKTASKVLERFLYGDSWGEWMCVSDYDNNLLWMGALFMHEGQTVNLPEPLSKQPHGIVLRWSYYTDATVGDNDDGINNPTAQNYNFIYKFIPKEHAKSHPGGGVFVSNAYAGIHKYVYINDNSIGGNSQNDIEAGTANGIAYNNRKWVLRAVIGV